MGRKLQKRIRKLLTILLFLIKFNLLAIPMYLIIHLNLSFQPLQNFLASLTKISLNLLGYYAIQQDSLVITTSKDQLYSIEVSWDSTGWKSMYAILALTISTPIKSWKRKLKFMAISIPTIFLINFLRILTTILVTLHYGFNYFEIVHTFLWREGLILAVVCIWSFWVWSEKDNLVLTKIYLR
jgi:exosortase/archaeosortase family protein